MKKIILASLAVLFIAAQGCSLKQGVSYYGNNLTYRGWIDETSGFEAGLNITFSYSESKETEGFSAGRTDIFRGWNKSGFDIGAGYLHKLLTFDGAVVIGAVKYREHLNYFREYQENNYYNTSDILYSTNYYESEKFNFFNNRTISLVFPEAEIELPFVEGLKLLMSMDLLVFEWKNKGGYYYQDYYSSRDFTYYYYYLDNGVVAPGSADSFKVYTVAQGPARMRLGLVYYFQ